MTLSDDLLLRPELAGIPGYVPGRSEAEVAAAYGLDHVIKLASNESAHGPLPGVLERAVARATSTHRYPDTDASQLRHALADRFDLDPSRIVAGCGSVALCQQLTLSTAGPGDEVLFPWRSFEAYPVFTAVVGATPVRVPLRADFSLDLQAMARAVTDRTRLVLVCTPNNPTGPAVSAAELEAFLAVVPPRVTVVIDEAYLEYAAGPDLPDGLALARRFPNVAVLRTFSKAYGLAALRVGWCYAPPALAEGLRRTSIPFAVSALAEAAAVEALQEQAEVARRATETIGERERVTAGLRAAGIAVPDSQANFVWLPLGERSVAFTDGLIRQGLITRCFAGDGIRVTLGLPAENDLLLAGADRLLRAGA
ncbi:MAG TPA: histidinol-phosphate transaminase [Frankiaceae bacterium]